MGANDGLKRLETCFNPSAATAEPVVEGMHNQTAPRIPPIARDTESVDPEYQQALSDTTLGAPPVEDNPAKADGVSVRKMAAGIGMHTITSPSQPSSGDLQADAQTAKTEPKAAEPAAAPEDAAATTAAVAPDTLVDQMLKKPRSASTI